MTPHRSTEQIQRELDALRRQLQTQEPLPSLPVLEAKVQKLTTKAVLAAPENMGGLRADLYEATKDLEQAQQVWQKRAQDNLSVTKLTNELNEAVAAERIARVQTADKRLGQAIDEYHHACLVAAKAFRNLRNVQHQTSQIPGAQYNLPNLRLDKFNIPHLIPMSWQGTLGESMLNGPMPWEDQGRPTSAYAEPVVLKVA